MMEKLIKIGIVQIRATPIMEILTGIIIGGFIYYTGLIVSTGEIQINNFFSFLTAMMLAYQPVRSLATLNITFSQGFSGAYRVLPLIDQEKKIYENDSLNNIIIDKIIAISFVFKNVYSKLCQLHTFSTY